MARAFESCLGDLGRPISLGRPLKELLDLELDQRSAYLLSRVDVNGSLAALIDGSAMPRFEACRTLCRLVLRKMIILG